MCLSQPIEIEDLSRTEQKNYKDFIGWKVFRGLKEYHCLAFFRDKFTFQYQSTTLNYIPRRRWLKSSKMRHRKVYLKELSYRCVTSTYKSGFHIFLSYKEAKIWRDRFEYGLIKKVKFRKVTSLGCQKGWYHSNNHPGYIFNCVVADQMLVF